tara:strand:- start:3051 stop:3209 length:159 start_codon:yes stop_codon:yes gene_type:complete
MWLYIPKTSHHSQFGYLNIEISESLNISIKTVEGHITKAFKLLREEVKNLKL